MEFFNYIQSNYLLIFDLFVEHIALTAIAVAFSILIGVPLGILTSYVKPIKKPVMGLANLIQAIPSIALLGFMIPLFGIGETPAIVAVVLYSFLPIIKNTNTGLSNIPSQTLETAKGIGLNSFQRLFLIQFPLALPVIMSGVRISAVTAVGLMTVASYIGAGGLGQLVIAGISSMNISKILAGAIPACILALAVDLVFSIIEKLIVPKGISNNITAPTKKEKVKLIVQKVALVMIVVLLGVAIILPPILTPKYDIVLGSKSATEPELLNYIYAEYIEENTDLKVDRRTGLGDTQPIYAALKQGDIDIVLGYSGTAYNSVLGHEVDTNLTFNEFINTIRTEMKQQYNVDTLAPVEFNNTYAFGVTQSVAEKYNLNTVSDLANIFSSNRDFTLGCTFMFSDETRMDGIYGVEKEYGFKLRENQIKKINGALRYQALANGEVDVIDAYSTDGLIAKYNLKILQDDRNFFPSYNVVPFINTGVLKKYPQLKIIDNLAAKLTNDVMASLNYEVDVLHKDAKAVAHNFLVSNNLI